MGRLPLLPRLRAQVAGRQHDARGVVLARARARTNARARADTRTRVNGNHCVDVKTRASAHARAQSQRGRARMRDGARRRFCPRIRVLLSDRTQVVRSSESVICAHCFLLYGRGVRADALEASQRVESTLA
eukprot:6191428-Pleurochrysis_carterae.AAC.2